MAHSDIEEMTDHILILRLQLIHFPAQLLELLVAGITVTPYYLHYFNQVGCIPWENANEGVFHCAQSIKSS